MTAGRAGRRSLFPKDVRGYLDTSGERHAAKRRAKRQTREQNHDARRRANGRGGT